MSDSLRGSTSPGPTLQPLPSSLQQGGFSFMGVNVQRNPLPRQIEFNGPAAYNVDKISSLGKQTLSKRESAPSPVFGKGTRETSSKVYTPGPLNPMLQGLESPPPKYTFPSSMGQQVAKPSSPSFKFAANSATTVPSKTKYVVKGRGSKKKGSD